MPMTKERVKQYPANWAEFSLRIRTERAGGRCECEGECWQARPSFFFWTVSGKWYEILFGHVGRCKRHNGEPIQGKDAQVVLTVAHLCRCDPPCAIAEHVKAMCQRCHLRLDMKLHRAHARLTRDRKTGQRRLFEG